MKRSRTRWIHAANVALAATFIVGVVAFIVALVMNTVIIHHLDRSIDVRLASALSRQVGAPSNPSVVASGDGDGDGDVGDAPMFIWHVAHDHTVTALTAGEPELPVHSWRPGVSTLTVQNSTFRFDAVETQDGWLVAGQSSARAGEAGHELLVVELALGALLLVVTFSGSFVVGLRASAPIEQVRLRQAEFTADASHELRTPLSVIQAEVDVTLTRPREREEYEASLQRIASENHRLQGIVDDLLWLARTDGASVGVEVVEPVDIGAIADVSATRFVPVAEVGEITIEVQTGRPRTAWVLGDWDQMDTLLGVLLDNACRFAGRGGIVRLTVEADGNRVLLKVEDTGPGIPVAQRPLIFDRFHRADDLPGGTGLGLAIADTVVRQSGGAWNVGASRLGGACMEITWRRTNSRVAAEAATTT